MIYFGYAVSLLPFFSAYVVNVRTLAFEVPSLAVDTLHSYRDVAVGCSYTLVIGAMDMYAVVYKTTCSFLMRAVGNEEILDQPAWHYNSTVACRPTSLLCV